MKILLIDDDRTVITPIAASQWTEAVEALEHGPPDLVLLYLNMPTVDGPSLLKFMRKRRLRCPCHDHFGIH